MTGTRRAAGFILAATVGSWVSCGGDWEPIQQGDSPAGGDSTNGDPLQGDPVGSGDLVMGDPGIDPFADEDHDGLPNGFEIAAGMPSVLNWQMADTDTNGTDDGDEDPDGDGVTNLEEYAFSIWDLAPAGTAPHPLRMDIFVELDAMTGYAPSDAVLGAAASAFESLPHSNLDGTFGVGLHFVRDEEGLTPIDFSTDVGERIAYLSSHDARVMPSNPAIPLGDLLHVVIASRTADGKFGEMVWHGTDPEQSGVFVYSGEIEDLFPQCAMPPEPPITPEDAVSMYIAHEVGHALQLGHDTEVGGGINYYNVMATEFPSCVEARMWAQGDFNTDESLGNTSTVRAPRFSDDAYRLMQFDNKGSVDTGTRSVVEM